MVVLAGVVTVADEDPVTVPTPLFMANVKPEPPLTDQASVVVSPVVFVEGVAVKDAIDGAGLIVAELCTGICRSLTTSTLSIDGAVAIEKVMACVFRPDVMDPLVKDHM